MPFIRPAARALQALRHPALDVHVGRGRHNSSPGAGNDNPHLYYNNELDHDHDGPTVLTTDPTPVPTAVVANAQTSSIGNTPALSSAVGGSTSVATQSGLPLSGTVPSSMLSASSNIILSSSSSPVPILTTIAVTSSVVLQTPVTGSSTIPVRGGGKSSSAPAESALAGATNNSSRRPSGGVIAAIVIVLLLASCAVAFFVFRRYRIQKRVARRVTWTTNLSPQPFDASLEKGLNHEPAVSSDARIVMASQISKETTEGGNGQVKPLPLVRNIARKPPLQYSPDSPIAPSPSQSHISIPDARAPSTDSASVSTVPSTPVPDIPALVRMTFVPQLPDELAITPGETVYIRAEFDDGWALCGDSRGKQGMVPLECLEGGGGQFAAHSPLRNTRRASSLNSAVTWS